LCLGKQFQRRASREKRKRGIRCGALSYDFAQKVEVAKLSRCMRLAPPLEGWPMGAIIDKP